MLSPGKENCTAAEPEMDPSTLLFVGQQDGQADVVDNVGDVGIEDCTVAKPEDGTAELFRAAQEGRLADVEVEVERGVALDVIDGNGMTALQVAAKNDHWDIVRFLASRSPEAQEAASLLWVAAEYGHPGIVKTMLKSGRVAVDKTDSSGSTALCIAAQHGCPGVVATLLAAEANVWHAKADGQTAVHLALRHRHTEVLCSLLQTLPQKKCWYPSLSKAANDGNVEAVLQCMMATASHRCWRWCDEHWAGPSPLWFACNEGHLELATLLVAAKVDVDWDSQRQMPLLSVTAERGNTAVAQLLLSAKAEVDKADNDGRTPLWVACEKGQLKLATLLVTSGKAEVDKADKEGRTPLWVACEKGHLEVATMLATSAKAEVDKAGKEGLTPLWVACDKGHLELATMLVTSGKAEVDKADIEGRTPLWVACNKGRLDLATMLVSSGKAEVDKGGEETCTPLWVACGKGHGELAGMLLRAGAAVDPADSVRKQTPLHAAIENGSHAMAWLLISAKAEVDKADSEGRTPLWVACDKGHLELATLLVVSEATLNLADHSRRRVPLHVAVEKGCVPIARLLLSAKAEVDKVDSEGRTPLWVACDKGHLELATLLVTSAKAEVDKTDNEGRTPLWVACDKGHLEVAALLANATKAGVDKPDKKGRTPLWNAFRNNDLKVATLLVEAGATSHLKRSFLGNSLYVHAFFGNFADVQQLVRAKADVNQTTKEGGTPLGIACELGHMAVVELLLSVKAKMSRSLLWNVCERGNLEIAAMLIGAGAGVDQADKDGRTPLFTAAHTGHLAMAKLLLSGKAEVDHADNDGETPLYVAVENGQYEVAQLFLLSLAEVDKARKNGRTPLWVACEQGNLRMAQLLVEAGAQANQADRWGHTPLFSAVEKAHTDVAKLLVVAKAVVDRATEQRLWDLYDKGNLEMALLLANVNHCRKDGSTVLLMAARQGQLPWVQKLLDFKADPYHVDNEGYSPLWVAVQYQHCSCVEALLKAKADANFRHPHSGRTSLMCAAATGNVDTINLLLARGARADMRDNEGFTTYYHADPDPQVEAFFAPPLLAELLEMCGDPKATKVSALVELLNYHAVDVNAGDKYLHWTALMEAVLFGSPEVVSCLVSHGADPAVRMFSGYTAAFWAKLRGVAPVQAALGVGLRLSPKESAGLQAIQCVRQQSPEAEELLAFNVGGSIIQGQRRRRAVRNSANICLQDRMADVTFDTTAGQFFPKDYQCSVSLYRFLTANKEVQRQCPEFDRKKGFSPVLNAMVVEGRKVVAVQVAQLALCFKGHVMMQSCPGQRPNRATANCSKCNAVLQHGTSWQCDECAHRFCAKCWSAGCIPEDIFALFCYTYDSVAYQSSNWAMREWRKVEAQVALQLWRPFIYHCEQALRRLPQRSSMVYRGIPIPFVDLYGKNKTFVWPSFSSTSELLKVAQNFAGKNGKSLIFIIKGDSGVSICNCSQYPSEAEVLFPPNLHLQTRWLGRQSVLSDTKVLLNLPQFVNEYNELLEPHELGGEEAKQEDVVVVYCKEMYS